MDMLLLASAVLTDCFSLYYKWSFLPSKTICCHLSTLCYQSSSPSLHLSMSRDLREYHHHMSSAVRHYGRSGTVRPPSFHGPLALICAHAGGLWEAIQTPS